MYLIESFKNPVFFIVIYLIKQLSTQEEFLDDQGRYVFDAPPSIRNKNKQPQTIDTNSLPNVIINIQRPSPNVVSPQVKQPNPNTILNTSPAAPIRPIQDLLPELTGNSGQFPPLIVTPEPQMAEAGQNLLPQLQPITSVDQFPPIFIAPNINAVTTSTAGPARNPRLHIDVIHCLRACPTTTEFNPVCGTDGISYANVHKLQCAKRCGQDVSSVRRGRCRPFAPVQH